MNHSVIQWGRPLHKLLHIRITEFKQFDYVSQAILRFHLLAPETPVLSHVTPRGISDRVALRQALLGVNRISPVNIYPPMPHTHISSITIAEENIWAYEG